MSDVKITKEEQIKQEKAGLDVLADIYRYSKTGFDSIDPDDMVRFKWHGVYQQRPKDGHFMMRVKVPGGRVTSDQFRMLAKISTDYGHGISDITTRQTIQFHWLTIQQMPDVFARLEAAGMTTAGACGDIARNITASPASGFDPDELVDTTPVVEMLQAFFHMNKDFGDLPRKYKIAVEGSTIESTVPQVNDAALIAYRRPSDGVVGYHFFAGGGLSIQPHMAKMLDIFVPATELEKIKEVIIAISELYRDAPKLRANRKRARLKYYVEDIGAAQFTEEVRKKLSWTPDHAVPGYKLSDETFRDHLGVNRQKQPGLNWIGICVLPGRMTDVEMRAAADIAEQYGSGELRLTNVQNFLIPNIADDDLEAAKGALAAAGFSWNVPTIRRGAMACTGIEFCNLALTDTKERMKDIIKHLEVVNPEPYERGIKINMNGCPNSCAQHHIGDIGLQGCLARLPDGEQVEAYDIHLGGDLGAEPTFTRAIHRKVPADKIKYAIENVLGQFQQTRQNSERFAKWVHRHTNEELDQFLGVDTIVGAPDLATRGQGDEVPA